MPQLVRTPEQVLRETKQDLYVIQFGDFFEKSVQGKDELLGWLASELPEVELEDLGPPEKSGIIEGGCGVLVRVKFDEASLKKYTDAWESADGKSKDPRWQCYVWPYEKFAKEDEGRTGLR